MMRVADEERRRVKLKLPWRVRLVLLVVAFETCCAELRWWGVERKRLLALNVLLSVQLTAAS